jgi:hypothetical protein
MRHGYTAQGHALRNWAFEGSEDGLSWHMIRRHENDETMGDKFELKETGSFDVSTSLFFSFFRITVTGPTSTGSEYLMVAGFEMYGESMRK